MSVPTQVAQQAFGVDQDGKPVSVGEKYLELKAKIIDLYDERVWFLTEAALSVHVSCLLADIANPMAMVFVDGPSTEKTTVLDFFEKLPMNYRIDKFTPASFLTQSSNVKSNKLKDVDLLPKIAYKVMMVPEMAPLFNQQKDVLMENYAILARVFDGSGLVNAGGTHGERKLTGDYMFGFLGATTPLSQTAWNTMGKVGARLIFLNAPARLSKKERLKRAKAIMTPKLHYKKKKKLAQEAVKEFIMFLSKQSEPQDYAVPDDAPEGLQGEQQIREHCGYLPRSIEWDSEKDDEEVVDKMALMAEFLTRARSDTKVWTERDENGNQETNSTGAVEEGVDRFTSIIYNLARSHAIVCGRNGINSDDLPLVIAVALSSLPDDRRKAVELIIDSPDGEFSTSVLQKSMSCVDKTAKTIMRKLEIVGIGRIKESCGPGPARFILDKEYDWLLSDDFRSYYRQWDSSNAKDTENEIDPTF